MKLGTVIKISDTVVVDGGGTADEVTIDIYDPDGNLIVDAGAMDESSSDPGVWEYIYQSATDDTEGVYPFYITANSGGSAGYDAVASGSFKLHV